MPHSLSDMSAPDPWGRSLLKITALNRFAHSEDAGIKPGEDAHDLIRRTSYRRQDTAKQRTASPNAAHRSPGGVPDRLKTARRDSDVQPPGQSSSSSDFSNYSNSSSSNAGSNGSSSSSSSNSSIFSARVSDRLLARRSGTYRALPYHINDPSRIAYQHRLSSVSDVSEAEPPSCFEFSDYWEGPLPRPLAEKIRAVTTTDSIAPSLVSRATTLTEGSLLEPDMPHNDDHRPRHPNANATSMQSAFIESPPFTPSIQIPDPLNNYSFPLVCSKVFTETAPTMSRGSSSQGQAVDNRTTQASLDEHNEMVNSTATIQHQSDSGASHEEPDTPNSDHDNSDDTPSENDDSDCLSESSGDAVQRDFLDDLLLPVKHQLVERLMVYVANNPDLNIPLPSILPEIANNHQKNEIAPSLSSGLVHLGTSTQDQKVSLKYEVLEKNQDDSTKETSLVADSKETQHSPGQVGQRPTTSRGYGQSYYTTQAGSSNSRAGKKRKNGSDGSPEGNGDNGDDDEDERCRASKSRRSQSPHSPQRRIACPYFQRNPMRTAKADSCFRNGFSSIAKMKEHLERVHDNSIQCPRCYEIFKKQDQLDSHLRVGDAQMCRQAQTRPDLEGYSSAQANRLKERMRSRTVEDKWNTIWKILFPADTDRDIQSPWWDPTRRPDFYGRYEEFQREDLPTRITPQIMAFVDFLLADDRLRRNIDAIVRNALEESLDAFKTREAAGQFAPRDGEAGPLAAGEGPSNAGPSFTGGPAMVALVQTQRGLDVWRPAPGDADVGFGETGAQPQGVQMPHRMVAAPVINEPEAVRTEANNDYQDVDGSFLNVDNGGSAMHTPFGHTPEGQWDGGSDDFMLLYGDSTFPSDTQASYGGNV